MNNKDMYNRCIVPEIVREERGLKICSKPGTNKTTTQNNIPVEIVMTKRRQLQNKFTTDKKVHKGRKVYKKKICLYK